MKITVLLGSRNADGKTAEATRALSDALVERGAEVGTVILPAMIIESCGQCNLDGWGDCHTTGRCIIKDDFASIVERIESSDLAVFSTPVYYSDLSESMKAFTDRLRRCNRSTINRSGENPYHIPVIGICNAGGGGGGSYQCATNLEKVLSTCGFEVIDIVPVRRQNFAFKLQSLRLLGDWLSEYIESGEWRRIIPRP